MTPEPLSDELLAQWETYRAEVEEGNRKRQADINLANEVAWERYNERFEEVMARRDQAEEEYQQALRSYLKLPWYKKLWTVEPVRQLIPLDISFPHQYLSYDKSPSWEGFLDWLVKRRSASR